MDKNALAYMEIFLMALADKTRLRLLNLMRGQEICVYFFTEILGHSQPKISRHLAYLRKAGLVKARREGKWMFYSISEPKDEGVGKLLNELLDWLGRQQDLCNDRENYLQISFPPAEPVQIGFNSMPVTSLNADILISENRHEEFKAAHNELEEFLL